MTPFQEPQFVAQPPQFVAQQPVQFVAQPQVVTVRAPTPVVAAATPVLPSPSPVTVVVEERQQPAETNRDGPAVQFALQSFFTLVFLKCR